MNNSNYIVSINHKTKIVMLNIGYNQDFSNVNATYVNVTKYVGPKIQPKPDYAYKLISNKKKLHFICLKLQ